MLFRSVSQSRYRDTAKALFESFTPKSFDGKGKFDQVRARLSKTPEAPKNIVESSIEPTMAKVEEGNKAVPGNMSLNEYRILSGLK